MMEAKLLNLILDHYSYVTSKQVYIYPKLTEPNVKLLEQASELKLNDYLENINIHQKRRKKR